MNTYALDTPHFKIGSMNFNNLNNIAMNPIYWEWLRDLKTCNTEDAWFWNEEWQTGEIQADKNFREGQFVECKTIDEVIAFLNGQKKAKKT